MNSSQRRTSHQSGPTAPHPKLDDADLDVDDKCKEEARARSKSVLSNFRRLRAIADRHEEKIQKRWAKKSRSQRLSILMEAWPDMPANHRPDFVAFRRYGDRLPQMAAELRSAFMLPYINQEDLAKPGIFPLLLNARARNHPSSFAASDNDAMHMGVLTMVLVPDFLKGYTITLNGMTDDEDYGRLVSWFDHDDAFEWYDKSIQHFPGEDLFILEAQDRLMSFLVACCGKILHEIPPDSLLDDAYPVQPEPALKSSIDASGFKSMAVLAEEAPYRPPANLDLDSIESLISARLLGAEDHIWALREDPSYFAERIFELKEHQPEMIKDDTGNVHPTLKPPLEYLLWAKIAGRLVADAFFQLEMYSELHAQARHLRDLKRQYEARISPLKRLPGEYLLAILKLRHTLSRMAWALTFRLNHSWLASPPMRSTVVRGDLVSTAAWRAFNRAGLVAPTAWREYSLKPKPGFGLEKSGERLVWLLDTLWKKNANTKICRQALLVDELDRLVKADPKVSEMVSAHVAMLISEASILTECMRQLDTYQPWGRHFNKAYDEYEDAIHKHVNHHMASCNSIQEAMDQENLSILRDLGDLVKMTSDYPISKRRTKENVGKLRAAESNLDLFWARIDGVLYAKMKNLRGTRLGQLLSQPRALQRTPEWVELEPRTKDRPMTPQPGGLSAEVLYLPFSSLSFEDQDSNEKLAVEQKTKVKTRGASEVTVVPEEPQIPTPVMEDVQPTFKVDARASRVFRIVFFTPGTSTAAGEVAWNDFLHAMASTRFEGQKLYGSVWHFQPTKLDVERSIQFHEPHPKGKLPFQTAKHFGRRLNRAYGWHGGMFVPTD